MKKVLKLYCLIVFLSVLQQTLFFYFLSSLLIKVWAKEKKETLKFNLGLKNFKKENIGNSNSKNALASVIRLDHLPSFLLKISLSCCYDSLPCFLCYLTKGLKCNPKHWPCLDLLCTVLYAIGDYYSKLFIVCFPAFGI